MTGEWYAPVYHRLKSVVSVEHGIPNALLHLLPEGSSFQGIQDHKEAFIRKAGDGDVTAIHELIQQHRFKADGSGQLIPVNKTTLYALAEAGKLFVAEHGGVIGCGSVISYDGIAELRSVVVAPENQKRGYGNALIEYGKRLAAELGYSELYALVNPEALPAFRSSGFSVVSPRPLQKIERDCVQCPLYKNGCREKTLVCRLEGR
ncbi:MAG: GNAT family N-acetyltransferase [Candidatus Aenigmarchaeota archaeon]|nr:GNAT family N-acetyltransferase [Candidatus Aenigmarchaeota archaeon]